MPALSATGSAAISCLLVISSQIQVFVYPVSMHFTDGVQMEDIQFAGMAIMYNIMPTC